MNTEDLEYINDIIRKEIEHCARLSGFLFSHGMSGGTGSGVGSLVTEFLRDQYENVKFINGKGNFPIVILHTYSCFSLPLAILKKRCCFERFELCTLPFSRV